MCATAHVKLAVGLIGSAQSQRTAPANILECITPPPRPNVAPEGTKNGWKVWLYHLLVCRGEGVQQFGTWEFCVRVGGYRPLATRVLED